MPKSIKIIKRSRARLIAIQLLYQYDFYERKEDIAILTDELLDSYILDDHKDQKAASYRQNIDLIFFEKLVPEVILVLPKIDDQIGEFLKGDWNIDILPDIMLAILRLAVFELQYLEKVPLKVIINEYVDIAGCFYDAKKITFVNGILDKIANEVRK